MIYGPAKFKQGSWVRVTDREFLEDFLRSWKYHHKLQPDQLAYSGYVSKVKHSMIYHGGDVLYELVSIPGIWHEQCLNAEISPPFLSRVFARFFAARGS